MAAEEELRIQIERKFPDKDEAIVTELFQAELRTQFEIASAAGSVAEAFQKDLETAFDKVTAGSLRQISAGAEAIVSFHPNETERVTGGDFGIVLVRPDIRQAQFEEAALSIKDDYQRGLLAQAKILKRNSRWRTLTSTQKKTLRGKESYLALVLYRYKDNRSERRHLAPFEWQLAKNATVTQMGRWLARGRFPSLQESTHILGQLSLNQIGTDNKEIIAANIAPPLRPSLTIKIGWPDGRRPPNRVYLELRDRNQQHHLEQLRVRQ
jgi:hypothetical protein